MIYVDMDGVLCNFLKGVALASGVELREHKDWEKHKDKYWRAVQRLGIRFWENLEWMPHGKELWALVEKHNPRILSAFPQKEKLRPAATYGKQLWLQKNINDSVSSKALICRVQEKQDYAKPGDILIDDNEKTIHQWNAKGGIGILYTDSGQMIQQLKVKHGLV